MTLPPLHEVRGRSALKAIRANNLEFFASAYKPGREIVRLQVGPRKLGPELFMNYSPDAAELIFSAKSYQNFPKENRVYRQIRLTMGDGILTAWGDDWIRQKTFIQPIFTRARVEGYLDPILDELNKTIEELRAGPSMVDIGHVMQHFTLRVVCRVLFGADLNADEEAIIERHFPALNKLVVQRASQPMPLPFSWNVGINKQIHESRNALFRLCDDVIARRRASPGGDDLASLLVAARDGDDRLSDAEIRDQILIFLLAGHETTSTSLTFAFHLLGRHPEEQAKVAAEAASVIGVGPPTVAQLNSQMPYTTAVLKEAMRLYPAAPVTGRRSIEPTTIGGHDVPAGSDLVISVWNIHRREDLWPDPLRFDPERFIGTDIGRYAWLPFGAGPRACIGQHFSMLESIAAIAMIVKAFKIDAVESSDHLPVGSGITLYPLAPVRVRVAAR